MPIQVTKMIPSTDVRNGEEFVYDGRTYTALTVNVKQKYTHITHGEEAHLLRIRIDHQVEVTRDEATQEEIDQAEHDRSLRYCQRALMKSYEDVEKRRQALIDNLEMNPSWSINYWMRLAEAQTACAIWKKVQYTAVAYDLDLVEAVGLIADEMRTELAEHLRFTSRSTSTASNLAEDVENETRVEWLRTIKWHVRSARS